jgi:predicted NBD/HSP70 family sugar kinase
VKKGTDVAHRGDLTRAAVLALLGRVGPQSRTDLARALGLSAAALSTTTRDLIDRHLVVETSRAPSQGGRPAVILELAAAAGCALGVKVSHDHLSWTWAGMDGTSLATGTRAFDPTVDGAAAALADLLQRVVAAPPAGLPPLLGVGVAVPGQVADRDAGTVTAPTIGWVAVPLGRVLADRLRQPVLVENDVNALAVAEQLYGLGADEEELLVLTIGRGIGAAVVTGGRLVRGAGGGAGELGHVPVDPEGPTCTCGNRGCLEALIGEDGLSARARTADLIGPDDGVSALVALADRGDTGARALLADAGRLLGQVLAGAVNLLDPRLVAVLGEGTPAWSHWAVGLEPALRAGLLASRRDVPLVVQDWDDSSCALGAAALVLASPQDAESGHQGDLVRARMTDTALAGSPS